MKVNFIVENKGMFKYLGCSSVAKDLYKGLSKSKSLDIKWNSESKDFDIAHFHTFGPKALLYKKGFKGKKVITAHSTPHLNKENLRFSSLINSFYKPLYNSFDHLLAVSNDCKKQLIKEGMKKDISVIYNPVDTKKFSFDKKKREKFRKKYNLENKFVILNLGQKIPRKGIYDFFEVARKVRDAVFIWVGGIPYSFFSKDYGKIKQLQKNKPSNVILPGFLEDIVDAYSGADLFFAPTHNETFGLTQAEALSCNLPILTRDLPVFKEVYGNKILKGGNNKEFISLIKKLMEDKKLRKKYSNFNSFVKKNFSVEKISEEHIKFYKKLLKE